MPMGVVSNDDFEIEKQRLERGNGDKRAVTPEVIDIKRGRTPDTKEVPEVIREAVALAAIKGEGTAKEISEAFGVSSSSVSAYKVGAHSTTSYDSPNESLLDSINGHKEKISKKARARLLSALNHITPDKLASIKARDLAAIAKDMSAIISDMEPAVAVNQNQQNNVQFVFMAPRVQNIDSYPTMNVAELDE